MFPLLAGALGLFVSAAHAQWATESFPLKAGWNAIYLPLDVPHTSITEVAHAQIEELWRWNALPDGHFTDVPTGSPSQTDLEWNVWRRASIEGTTLGLLTGNAAYLVKVSDGAADFTWLLRGKPLPPKLDWSSTGINFVGFPTNTQPAPAVAGTYPTFSRFFGFDPVLRLLTNGAINYYKGGPLSDIVGPTKNPAVIPSLTTAQAARFQAYWVKATEFTRYYGPFRVELGHADGLQFGPDRMAVALRLTNVVDATKNQTVTVTLAPSASEIPPVGQPPIAAVVPLLERGAIDLSTGQHTYIDFTAPITRVLAPGANTEVVFAVNRSAMGNTPGAVFQSLLTLTDSLNQTRINLPVSAITTSRAGLWGGAALVTKVDRIVGQDETLEDVKAGFPIRLLLHSDASGQVRLLSQAYVGEQNGQPAVSASEGLFTTPGKAAARVSSSHFPTGLVQPGTGALGLTGTLTFTVTLAHTAGTNPFVHIYHPDHDNLDARYETTLPAGVEAPAVTRSIKLTFNTPALLAFNPAWGATQLGGTYEETVTGLRRTPIRCSGTFLLERASSATAFLQP